MRCVNLQGTGGVIEKHKYMNHENTVYRHRNIRDILFLYK